MFSVTAEFFFNFPLATLLLRSYFVFVSGTRNNAKLRRRGKRVKGIGFDAARLGVTRWHLSAVLHGRRESKPLVARYRNLKRGDK
jgi:hypothetical protein